MNRLKTVLLRSFILFLFLFSARAITHAQNLVLKPDDSITPWFGFTEWVLHHAAIPFDSYDLTSFSLLGSSNGLLTDEPPLVLIDGHPYYSKSPVNDEFILPNISLQAVDSVIISLDDQYKKGLFSSSGFIEIFLRKEERNALDLSTGLINEVNDPGPHINTELQSPNVEAVNYNSSATVRLPELMDLVLFFNDDQYTRTNLTGYKNVFNNNLNVRSRFFDGSADNILLQRNHLSELHAFNRIHTEDYVFLFNNSITFKRSFFSWNPILGVEIPYRSIATQNQFSIQKKRGDFFRAFNVHFFSSDTDSITVANPTFETKQLSVSSNLSLSFSDDIEFNIHQSLERLQNQGSNRSVSFPLYHASLIYTSTKRHTLSATFGNGEQSVSSIFKNTPFTELSFHTHRKDLQRFNNNLTRWDNQIGLSGSRRPINLTLEPDLINFSSRVGIAQSFASHRVSGSVRINALHHWELVHADIQYVPAQRGFESTLTYRTHRNIGSGSIQGHFNWQYAPGITFRSVLTVNQVLYANQAFRTFNERVPEVVSSSTINYLYNPNATFELLFKYVSSRFIHEFDGIEEQSDIILPPEVRPIYQLSFSANQYFFSQRLLLSLSLRNLINETISYNTNGQYYDMSIAVKATVRL